MHVCLPVCSTPWWVLLQHYCVAIVFHRRVWYRILSLHYACIQSSGIILIPYATVLPNFVSFAASVAELAHGEKSHTQSITLPAYLMTRKPKHLRFGTKPYFNAMQSLQVLSDLGKDSFSVIWFTQRNLYFKTKKWHCPLDGHFILQQCYCCHRTQVNVCQGCRVMCMWDHPTHQWCGWKVRVWGRARVTIVRVLQIQRQAKLVDTSIWLSSCSLCHAGVNTE